MNQYFDNHINPFNCSNFSIAEKYFYYIAIALSQGVLLGLKVDNFSLLINHLKFCLGWMLSK